MTVPEDTDASPKEERPATIPLTEYNAALAAVLLEDAHFGYEHVARWAERLADQPPADAAPEDILAEWRASNIVRREMMRLTHARGGELISAMKVMLAHR